ncbi:MAG TPA: hydrogenase maturation protease [Terriglobales bacterium]|nr:hydrogenase maturation protease [Terriglobales bacterium]
MARVLIIAFGNPLRCDDGVGWIAADQLRDQIEDSEIEILTCHQLQPELADRIAEAQRVIFIDASVGDPPGMLEVQNVASVPYSPGSFSHQLDPARLLACSWELYRHSPEAFVITVTGENFGYGTHLTSTVAALVPSLVAGVKSLINTPEPQPAVYSYLP